MKFKVLIIGCGNMAGGYDLRQPEEAMPLGHAKAFRQHGSFEVTACIDPNTRQREAFQHRWQVPQSFASWRDMSQQIGAFDVISICSPTGVHYEDIKAALALKPRLIFCEKPVTLRVDQTENAVTDCANHKVQLAVNHSRRWLPEVLRLRQQLTQGEWGAVRSVSAIYNKGMLNNGSHMLDLLLNLFGSLRITHVGDAVFDHFDTDPSVDACLLTSDGVPIQLNLAYAKDYALFEMQIVTEKGVINMEDGGARWRFRTPAPSIQLPGYNFLSNDKWLVRDDLPLLRNAVAHLYDALSHGVALACTGLHALQAQALCEQIQQRALARLPSPQER